MWSPTLTKSAQLGASNGQSLDDLIVQDQNMETEAYSDQKPIIGRPANPAEILSP